MAPTATTSPFGLSSRSSGNKRKRSNSTDDFAAGPTLDGLTPEQYLEKCEETGSSPLPWACPSGIVVDEVSCRPRKRRLMDDFDFKPETKRLRLKAGLAARRERLVQEREAETEGALDWSLWDEHYADVEKQEETGTDQESDGAEDEPELEEEPNEDEEEDEEEEEEVVVEEPERSEQDDQNEDENESESCTLYESSCGYRGRETFDSDCSAELSESFTSHDG